MPETNEDKVDEVFELVKNSSLSEEIKESFSQRRLEFLEDFSSNIVKITKAQEAHNKLYKSKTNHATGKKRPSDEGWVFFFSFAACRVANVGLLVKTLSDCDDFHSFAGSIPTVVRQTFQLARCGCTLRVTSQT